jgi:hypothetical protein
MERFVKWVRRYPAVAGLLAAVLLSLAGGIALSTWFALDAREQARQANEEKRLANEARDEAEINLARGWLRPVGPSRFDGNTFELDALWEVARSPRDRVRLRFLEEALAGRATAAQLDNRREWAVHAAVGLDPEKRRQAERLLRSKLQAPATAPEVRWVCARVGVALGGCDQAFARDAAGAILEALGKNDASYEFLELAEALAGALDRLPPSEAGPLADRAVARLVDVLATMNDASFGLEWPVRGVWPLAGRLPPERARPLARRADCPPRRRWPGGCGPWRTACCFRT